MEVIGYSVPEDIMWWLAQSSMLLSLTLLCSVLIRLSFGFSADAVQQDAIHEKGRCSIRGQCGKTGFFGKELPCPDNGRAEEPANETRRKLVGICGEKWSEGAICCDDDQVNAQWCV